MTEAPVPGPQPIAVAPADVDGTLVTRAKVVTARAIEAAGKLHDRQGVLRDHQRAAAARHACWFTRWRCAVPMAASNVRIIVRPDRS